jgi:Chalcone isomerase-like
VVPIGNMPGPRQERPRPDQTMTGNLPAIERPIHAALNSGSVGPDVCKRPLNVVSVQRRYIINSPGTLFPPGRCTDNDLLADAKMSPGALDAVAVFTGALSEKAYKTAAVLRARLFSCALIAVISLLPFGFVAQAAELDGVQVPNALQVDGKTLHLNGFGLRTYSILRIHIYVASLYLEHLNTDPEQIMQSPETKLLTVRFEREVSAEQARRAWRDDLDRDEVARFLAVVPAMHAGDNCSLLFTRSSATVTVNGKLIGTITHPQFAEAMLATFLGPKPASQRLKRELLQGHG